MLKHVDLSKVDGSRGNPWYIDEPMKQKDNMLTCQKLMEEGEIPGT